MCKWHGGSYEGNLPVKLTHPRKDGVNIVYVDACIQKLVQGLNNAGFQTINSCCGHGQRPGWIALENGNHILIAKNHEEMLHMSRGYSALRGENDLSDR